jgi:hypothetical protein
MDRKILIVLLNGLMLTACTFSLVGTPPPAAPLPASPTLSLPFPTAPLVAPTTPPPASPTYSVPLASSASPASGDVIPGSPSGPYAVILVKSNDVLNIRSGPGVDYPIIGSFQPTYTDVMRTGPSSQVDNALWVEVQIPSGKTGWVNAKYLTEYIPLSNVCDLKALTLVSDFERAVLAEDGELLASLVSPAHGVDVWAYRSGRPVNFDVAHARWVFESSYANNWGIHPASGLDIQGAFRDVILPNLKEVMRVSHSTTCNDPSVPGWDLTAWPEEYANINVLKLYKPATPGVDLDWRIWLAGVEYVSGQPYLFALLHFMWVP